MAGRGQPQRKVTTRGRRGKVEPPSRRKRNARVLLGVGRSLYLSGGQNQIEIDAFVAQCRGERIEHSDADMRLHRPYRRIHCSFSAAHLSRIVLILATARQRVNMRTRLLHNECKNTDTCVVRGIEAAQFSLVSAAPSRFKHLDAESRIWSKWPVELGSFTTEAGRA